MKKNQIQETFIVDRYQGAAAMLINIRKEGYKVVSIERTNEKAVVTYETV
jgi:hypothetical protein